MNNRTEFHQDPLTWVSIPRSEVSLADYWFVIWNRRWLLVYLFLGVVCLTIGITSLLPNMYESTATLLPQLESLESGGLGAILMGRTGKDAAESLGISLPGAPATPTDLFLGILKSRTVADELIRKFDLMTVYKSRTIEDARETLANNSAIKLTKEKVIKISLEDKDPQRAADMANFFVQHLDYLNTTLNVSKAGQNRKFIERRLSETQESLAKTEEELKDFQTKNKTVAVEAQSRVMIEAAAMIQAQIMSQEVQLQAMSSYLSPDNPQLVPLRSSLQELRKQLSMMEMGKAGKGTLPGERLHPAMISVPTLTLEYGRLLRELKVQETLYTLLTSQYEQAKMAEARDTPTVQVLDSAIPATKKSRPHRAIITAGAGFMSLVFGVFLAFLLEFRKRFAPRPIPDVSLRSGLDELSTPAVTRT